MPTKFNDLPRNSPAWAIDRFRADALFQIMNDLKPVGDVGIPDHECQKVKLALSEIIDAASSLPDGGVFRKAVWQHLQEYHDLYAKWNNIEGTSSDSKLKRHQVIVDLRDCRNRIAKATRLNIHILNKELDLALIDGWYKSLRKLVETTPRLFSQLGRAVERYFGRRGP